jgi:hypothetical protein
MNPLIHSCKIQIIEIQSYFKFLEGMVFELLTRKWRMN